MTRTPTAEEVIELFQKKRLAEQQAWRANADDAVSCMREEARTCEAFMEALAAYEQSQGPVTREWFVERFGASDIDQSIHGWTMHISLRGRVEIGLHDEYGEVYLELHNPTRERIEALVEMLGGESCG